MLSTNELTKNKSPVGELDELMRLYSTGQLGKQGTAKNRRMIMNLRKQATDVENAAEFVEAFDIKIMCNKYYQVYKGLID